MHLMQICQNAEKESKKKGSFDFFSIFYGIFTNQYKKLVQFLAFSSLLGLDLIF
jgi:hypothetical protein